MKKEDNMKTIKFNKKLVLNKTTVADLNGNEMKNLYGGGDESADTNCASCIVTCPETVYTIPCCPPPESIHTNRTIDPGGACCCIEA